MTRDEHEAQQVVADMIVERGVEVRHRPFTFVLELGADLLVLSFVQRVAAHRVDRAALGRGHQPRARIVGHARRRPLLERGDERVLREILGEADVADDARRARR